MKVYLKLNNQFWTGRLSAKGGKLSFVMTDNRGQATEFGSVESAMEYMEGWECRTTGWQIEIDYGKPEQSQCSDLNIPPFADKPCEVGIYQRYNPEDYKEIRRTGICGICNGTGANPDSSGLMICQACNGYGKREYFKRGGYIKDDWTYSSRRPDFLETNFGFYATPAPQDCGEGVLRFEPEKTKSRPQTKPNQRSISDICKEADSNKYDYKRLEVLFREVERGNYPKHEMEFALEHIKSYHQAIRERMIKESWRDRFTED